MIRLFALFLCIICSQALAQHFLPDLRGEITVDGTKVESLAEAEKVIKNGSKIELGSGTFPNGIHIREDNVTLSGSPKTHFIAALIEGRAAIITSGNNITIKNIECSRMTNRRGNGACILHKGKNLTIDNVYFRDSDEGILEARNDGRMIITDSRFERLGYRGRAHGIYTAGGELIIRNSVFISSVSEGHAIKSRSKKTVIENTLVASANGYDSRLLDISNGGELIVSHSLLWQNNNTSNKQLIGYAPEGLHQNSKHTISVKNNLVIMENTTGSEFIGLPEETEFPIDVSDNILVGEHIDKARWTDSNFSYKTRWDAESEINSLPGIKRLYNRLKQLE